MVGYQITGREKFNLIFKNMSNGSLADLFIGGTCPSEFGLFDKKRKWLSSFLLYKLLGESFKYGI